MATKPGQYILLQIYEHLRSIPTDISIVIKWCPGHSGVKGNELADQMAGQAAEEQQNTRRLAFSASAARSTAIIKTPKKKPDLLVPHLRQVQSPGISRSLPTLMQTIPHTTEDTLIPAKST
ncbi:hypothetical protein Pst134EB_010498 [Puccinia striiformis f. sp. tritici]|nr:hypothetical protein Pst134EB_010498 [Puccinia striiformis f. sp. tritici]